MKLIDETKEAKKPRPAGGKIAAAESTSAGAERRKKTAVGGVAVVLLAFAPILWALARHAAGSDLHSHILLIPFISGYLLYLQRDTLPKVFRSSSILGGIVACVGIVALAVIYLPGSTLSVMSENDRLAVQTLACLLFIVAVLFFFLGRAWLRAALFPVAFLIFMIPMPDAMATGLERASVLASAEAAELFFSISGTPFLRDGVIFQLPNIVIQVAQECSGIRSSWVLFITSLVSVQMFLRTPWRRAVLVAFIIPLGILRNGFRIAVIGLLCVNYGPEMIHSMIHKKGGPLFFALSLVPLFGLLWWLRRGEGRKKQPSDAGEGLHSSG